MLYNLSFRKLVNYYDIILYLKKIKNQHLIIAFLLILSMIIEEVLLAASWGLYSNGPPTGPAHSNWPVPRLELFLFRKKGLLSPLSTDQVASREEEEEEEEDDGSEADRGFSALRAVQGLPYEERFRHLH